MYRVSPFVRYFGRALLLGAALATLWVNLAPASYYDVIELPLIELPLPSIMAAFPVTVTPAKLVIDGLMALFLFYIGKELWEAMRLERGALSGKRGILPFAAIIGGWIGAISAWLGTGALIETALEATPGAGWPVPIGSDVVLCYVVGRVIFGAGHPALHLLLMITIANDIAGLVIGGLAYPAVGLHLAWLLLTIVAVLAAWIGFGRYAAKNRSERAHRHAVLLWPYFVAGFFSWLGVVLAGLPGALGLLPLIPAIPHSDRSFGLFAEAEGLLHDPLNRLAHLLERPLAVVLFLFGLTHGGVDLMALAPTTATVLVALWFGKPLGVIIGALIARAAGHQLPFGIRLRELVLIAMISGMGFTVPVLTLQSALPGGAMAEAARLGLAFSLGMAIVALPLARIFNR